MDSNKLTARLLSAFFIMAFITYGTGSSMVASVADAPESLTTIYESKSSLVIGVILMSLLHSLTSIGMPVVMHSILKPSGERFTVAYLSAGISATLILVVGTIFILLLIPLSDAYMESGSTGDGHFETLRILCVKASFYAYQLGMAIWGVGGLFMTSLLYRSRLVPRFLSVWGFVGYMVFIVGTIIELFGLSYGVELSISAGLFEVFISFLLIAKGFNQLPAKTAESR